MRCKVSSLVIFSCCVAAVVSAGPQSARTGISVIIVPMQRDAEELGSRIRQGASFEALAVGYSIDPSGPRAGYMGIVEESTLRQEYRVALRGLKPGQISSVIPVGDSFALLKRTTEPEDRWRSQQDSGVMALQQG